MINIYNLIIAFILGFVINLIIITYVFGPVMRYIIKPLYHKSWGANHKRYRKEFSFLNLFEDGLILIYFLFAIPLIFTGLIGFILILFSKKILLGSFYIDKIIAILGIIVMIGFGWKLIEHEERIKKKIKRR